MVEEEEGYPFWMLGGMCRTLFDYKSNWLYAAVNLIAMIIEIFMSAGLKTLSLGANALDDFSSQVGELNPIVAPSILNSQYK